MYSTMNVVDRMEYCDIKVILKRKAVFLSFSHLECTIVIVR